MTDNFENGVMLDIGRKYFSPDQIKRLISGLSSLGCSGLMLHFSEDMGLGLECPIYPWLAGRSRELCPSADIADDTVDASFITLDELRGIAEYADEMNIELIPSYDSPGHLNYTVKRFNDYVKENGHISFEYNGDEYSVDFDGHFTFYKNGKDIGYPEEIDGTYGIYSHYLTDGEHSIVKGTRNESVARGFDLCNEVGRAFICSVLESYAKLFYSLGCRKIDIGGDEMLGFGSAVANLSELTRWQQLDHWKAEAQRLTGLSTAVAYDLMVMYINGLRDMVRKIGYTDVRVWNDEFRRTYDTDWNTDPTQHIQFADDITVQYWSANPHYESPAALAENGYDIINCDSTYLYYVLLNKARAVQPEIYTKVKSGIIDDEWTPYIFAPVNDSKVADGWELTEEAHRRHLKGTYFCVWCDAPTLRTDKEVIDELLPLLKAWKGKISQTE